MIGVYFMWIGIIGYFLQINLIVLGGGFLANKFTIPIDWWDMT